MSRSLFARYRRADSSQYFLALHSLQSTKQRRQDAEHRPITDQFLSYIILETRAQRTLFLTPGFPLVFVFTLCVLHTHTPILTHTSIGSRAWTSSHLRRRCRNLHLWVIIRNCIVSETRFCNACNLRVTDCSHSLGPCPRTVLSHRLFVPDHVYASETQNKILRPAQRLLLRCAMR